MFVMSDAADPYRSRNLLGIPETRLPGDFVDVEVAAALADHQEPRDIAREHPESPLVWAELAQDALSDGDDIAAYAYARTGYHRGLDSLRRAGWKGFLKALALLGETSRRIGDDAEAVRVHEFLQDADPSLLA